jgi:hypothetical protein
MWLSDYGSPNAAHGARGEWPPTDCSQGVLMRVAKTQVGYIGVLYCKYYTALHGSVYASMLLDMRGISTRKCAYCCCHRWHMHIHCYM